ncbi:hypothetical protein GWK47_053155 [Chionoecetes opilio]|uniref:Uncharacterized protein n=1 Tax=Chionoecetes opilio TaxID=41210 RepID=A0A8J5CR10_CHIOP|nr:hypothetical protein GWK47_053155 [Chionoecetes opilio]
MITWDEWKGHFLPHPIGPIQISRHNPSRRQSPSAFTTCSDNIHVGMARPTTLLLAAVACYLCASLPPAASRPALLGPEGSYEPERETTIHLIDNLLNQLLNNLKNHGRDPGTASHEGDSQDAEDSQPAEVTPLPTRPTSTPPARPLQPGGSEGAGSHAGGYPHPGPQPGDSGRIVFPSDY